MSSLFLALKFKSVFRRRQKQYGAAFHFRFRNLIRRKLVCATQFCAATLAERAKFIIKDFIMTY